MLNPVRISPVATMLNRDLFMSKDSRLVNGVIEKSQDGSMSVSKRPAFKVATTVVGGGSDAGIIGGDVGTGVGVSGSGSGSTGYSGLGGGGFSGAGQNEYSHLYQIK